MQSYVNKNIVDFIAQTLICEPPDEKFNLHSKKISLWNFTELDTSDLRGLKLRAVELYNTISRLKYIVFPKESNQYSAFLNLEQHFIRFCQNNIPDSHDTVLNIDNRIYLDVTFTMQQVAVTGIPRVVTELARNSATWGIIPVFMFSNEIYHLDHTRNIIKLPNFQKNDILLLCDAGWNYTTDLTYNISRLTNCGGKSVALLYDLIPIFYPQLSHQNHVMAFNQWYDSVLLQCDNVICISNAVAHEFMYKSKNSDNANSSTRDQKIGWIHLGSDPQPRFTIENSANLSAITGASRPFFLSVGTVEPRKAYSISINAMDNLWSRGFDATFVIVGKYGWSQAGLGRRILSHPEFEKRLFWLESASDTDLQQLYASALALVSSSLCEGFGLPIIEAAHNGLASIVSDIPVFREIGGHSTNYFEVTNSLELSFQLEAAIQKPKVRPDLDFLTWQESVSQIIQMIIHENYQYKNS